MRMLWPRLRYYIFWLSAASYFCSFIAVIWILETAQRHPDALHTYEIKIKSDRRYVTAERHRLFNNAGLAWVVSIASLIALYAGQARRDQKQQKSTQQHPPSAT